MPSARQSGYAAGGTGLRKPLNNPRTTTLLDRPVPSNSQPTSTSTTSSSNLTLATPTNVAGSNTYQPPHVRGSGGVSMRSRIRLSSQGGENGAAVADPPNSSRRPVIPSLSFAKHEGLGFGTSGGIDECKSARLATGHSGGGHSRTHSTHPTPRLHQSPMTARQTGLAPDSAARGHSRVPSSSMLHCGPLTSAQVSRWLVKRCQASECLHTVASFSQSAETIFQATGLCFKQVTLVLEVLLHSATCVLPLLSTFFLCWLP